MKISTVLFLIIFLTGSFHAQSINNYTTSNSSLCNDTVWSIEVDSSDNKWFGTSEGLSFYNGVNWKTYSTANGLLTNKITCMEFDSFGNRWFGHNLGLSLLNDTIWRVYSDIYNVYDVKTDSNGILWLAASMEDSTSLPNSKPVLLKYDGHDFEIVDRFDEPYTSLLIDSNDAIWAANAIEICRYAKDTTVCYVAGIINNSIAIDKNGFLWSSDGYHFDGESFIVVPGHENLFNDMDYPNQIAIDQHNNKWFVTLRSGVWKFDGETWTNYTVQDGLASNSVFCVAIDRQDHKWFGTDAGISELIESESTPIQEQGNAVKVNVYPIPVYDQIFISLSELREPVSFELYDIYGHVLCSFQADTDRTSFDMRNYCAGVYIVVVKTANGQSFRKQFVKIGQ